jgi:hypothetical protein
MDISLLFVCLRMWVVIKLGEDERVSLWEFCALVLLNCPQIGPSVITR